MAINWSVSFRETLDDHVQMGRGYTRLTEKTTGEGGDRSRLGYEPARLRFQQIPSKMSARNTRLIDDAINDSVGASNAYEMTSLGWAFALTMRFYIENGAQPTDLRDIGDSEILRGAATALMANTPERAVLLDLPLEVQNILISSGLVARDFLPVVSREGPATAAGGDEVREDLDSGLISRAEARMARGYAGSPPDIPVVTEDRADEIRRDYGAGILTLDEALRRLGYD